MTLSGCGTQASLIHPCGRVFQYGSRIEAHTRDDEDHFIEKNAKIWPRGISFTSNTCALIYLVDEAGARSTSDFFHNLYAEDITDSKYHSLLVVFNLALIEMLSDAPQSVEISELFCHSDFT